MNISAVGKTYDRHYADFNPFSRTDQSEEGVQSWQPPGYTVFDLHAAYRLSDVLPIWKGGDLRVFVNVYNVFDELYVQDAVDNSRYNDFDGDHDADDAEVFLGYPRNINMGFRISF